MSAHLSPSTLSRIKSRPKSCSGLFLSFFLFLTVIGKKVAVLLLCLDRSYRKSTFTVRLFFFEMKEISLFRKPHNNFTIF